MAKQVQYTSAGFWNPWRLAAWSVPAILLTLPAILDFPWTAFDFVVMGVLFGLVGLAIELAFRASRSSAYRMAAGVTVMASFLLVWINLAAGIIGDEDNPWNLMYFGLILVTLAGAVGAGFRAKGMARTLFVAAAVQSVVSVIAVAGAGDAPPGPIGVAVLNLFFVAAFLGSAGLFRVAARDRPVAAG